MITITISRRLAAFASALAVAALLLFMFGPASVANPLDQADEADEASVDKTALAKELLAAQDFEKTARTSIEQSMQLVANDPNLPPGFAEAFMEEVDMEMMADQTAAVYAKHLDAQTLRGLIAFYQTPVGQAFAEKQAVINEETILVGQQLGQQWGMRAAMKLQGME
jgi:hypothetical protein